MIFVVVNTVAVVLVSRSSSFNGYILVAEEVVRLLKRSFDQPVEELACATRL